jgi:hypothetical protein
LFDVVTIAADALLRLARHRRRAHFTELAHRRVNAEITSWPDFYAATADRPMLARLEDYRDPLLIAGCDWSAVTAVSHLFKRLQGAAELASSPNDELDGALLLAGLRSERRPGSRRYFQTTYLGERYREYLAHEHFKLVWIVREPHAAVHSLLSRRERDRARRPPAALAGSPAGRGASRLEKACSAYTASIRQMLELKERLGERVAVVDYDELSADRTRLLPALCRFASVACNASLLRHLHGKSVKKGTLASFEAAIVEQLAMPAYRRARCAGSSSIAHG